MTESFTEARRSNSSRRRCSNGNGGRTLSAAPAAPYIVRGIPPYNILSDDALTLIEENADIILSDVGLDFRGNETALRLWREAGANVRGERVRFDRGICQEIIRRSAPREFTQHARNSARTVKIGGANTVFAPVYGPPFVRSLDFERRYARLEDFNDLVKLTYLSPNLHHSGGTIVEPTDVPANKRHLDMLYGHIRFSDKPFMSAVTAGERALDSIAMAKIVFGSDFVDQNCCLLGLINVNSPLVADDTMLAAMIELARHNQATLITPFIIAGASGLTSPAGMAAQAHAEIIAVMALTQLVRPGSPVICGYMVMGLNMRTGGPIRFDETWKSILIAGQLARRLGVPFRAGGQSTGSKIPDIQAGMEGTTYLDYSLLSGVNFLLNATGTCEAGLCVSMEKFMLDCDLLGAMSRMLSPIETGPEGFSLDDIASVGPGGNFLSSRHTMDRYRTVFFESELFDGNSFEQWESEGGQDAAVRANALLRRRLAECQPPPIDPAVDEALQEYIDKRKAQLPDSFA